MDFLPYTDRDPTKYELSANNSMEMSGPDELKQFIVSVRTRKTVYQMCYFDRNGIYRCKEAQDPMDFANENQLTYNVWNRSSYKRSPKPIFPKFVHGVMINRSWIPQVVNTLKPDVHTIEELVARYNFLTQHTKDRGNSYTVDWDAFFDQYHITDTRSNTQNILNRATTLQEVRDFILRVERPFFERETDNNKRGTFDFIRIRLSIPEKNMFPKRKDFIQRHLREICNIALAKIESTKSFQKYGVPSSFLKLENAMITADSQLELLFGLKLHTDL